MTTALMWCPLAVDAMVCQRKGQAFLDEFGEMMTGVRSKVAHNQPITNNNQHLKQTNFEWPLLVPDPKKEMERKEQKNKKKKTDTLPINSVFFF